MGVIEVLQGTNAVISGSDAEQFWQLRQSDPPDPSTLTVRGSSPGQAILTLEYTPNGQVYPGGQYNGESVTVAVVGVYQIEINASQWYDVTDYTITVLKGTKYTFRAKPLPVGATWPSQRPVWTLNGNSIGSPGNTSVEVTFDSVGTKTLTAKCGPNAPGKSVTINVVEPTAYQFGTGGDLVLNTTPDPSSPATWHGWADCSTPFTNPVYIEGGENDPICVPKNSNGISLIDVTLRVPDALTYPTTIRIDAAGTEDWNESSDVSFSGLTSGTGTLPITGNIINEVHKYGADFQIQWKYKVPSGTNTWYNIGTTSHTMYVKYTYETGGNSLTEKRIEWLCRDGHCGGDTTTLECSDHIWAALAGSPPDFDLGGGNVDNEWQLMDPDGPTGQCIDLAKLISTVTVSS